MSAAAAPVHDENAERKRAPLALLVVECMPNLDWTACFAGAAPLRKSEAENEVNVATGADGVKLAELPSGRRVQVYQAQWEEISIVSWGDRHGGCLASLKNGSTCKVDFVLMRSITKGIDKQDSRNNLFGLMHADVPSVNSLSSVYGCLERVVTWGELVKIERRLKKQGIDFPLIEQTYYNGFRSITVTPDVPCVAKVGAAQSGYGKLKLKSAEAIADFKSHLALHGDHTTIEAFCDWDWDGRLQKIGNEYRAFRRVSANWKGNVGNQSVLEDMEMRLSTCYSNGDAYGGLDICGLDFLHEKNTGKEYILELNDTAIGLVHKHTESDMRAIRDLVLVRMQAHFYGSDPIETSVATRQWRDSGIPAELPDNDDQDYSAEYADRIVDGVELASAEAALLKKYADENALLRAQIEELEAAQKKKKASFFKR